MKFLSALVGLCLISFSSQADESEDKFRVEGTVLHYDSVELPDGSDSQVKVGDNDALLRVLRQNNQIETLQLNSEGGDIWAGEEMARIALDFELDTIVLGECSSTCVTIFLAGGNRTMGRGAKIGFHGRNWSPDSIKKYFERNQNKEGWEDAFEFGSWIYRDTQDEVYDELSYMVGRGVEAGFAIETVKLRNSMWYPTRLELQKANVLREQ